MVKREKKQHFVQVSFRQTQAGNPFQMPRKGKITWSADVFFKTNKGKGGGGCHTTQGTQTRHTGTRMNERLAPFPQSYTITDNSLRVGDKVLKIHENNDKQAKLARGAESESVIEKPKPEK